MNASESMRNIIVRQAADWFVGNRAGLTARERAAFAAWLTASPVHVEEYLALAVITRDLRAACEEPDAVVEELVARARREEQTAVLPVWRRFAPAARLAPPARWQSAAVALTVLGIVTAGLLARWDLRRGLQLPAPGAVTTLRFETRHGEQQTHRLADESVLHLNTDSTVTVAYGPTQRVVTLLSGEADFEVVPAARRPFRVLAGSAEVLDVGTRFDVRLESDATVVTVAEGRVEVGLAAAAPERSVGASAEPRRRFVQLAANEQISVSAAAWPALPVPVDAQRATAWLRRQIVFEHEPLGRVASEFNRYSSRPIEIDTPALRNLEISGVFRTDDTEAFIAFLRSLEGVRVEVTPTRIRVSQD